MNSSRYQSLAGRRPVHQKEYFEGYYQNKPILIDRMFRGHRFSDEECKALCQGEWLELHNLQNGIVLYGVRGCLHQDIFASAKSSIPVYVFKVKTSLVNNPSYRFDDRKPYFGSNQSESAYDYSKTVNHDVESGVKVKKTKFILHESSVDAFSDNNDSELAAMVAANMMLPKVVEVKKNENDVKIFVPVIAGYRYTENGLEMIQDDEATFGDDVNQQMDVEKDVELQESADTIRESTNETVDEQSISGVQDVVIDEDSYYNNVVADAESDLYNNMFRSEDEDFEEPYLDEIEPSDWMNPNLVEGIDDLPFNDIIE